MQSAQVLEQLEEDFYSSLGNCSQGTFSSPRKWFSSHPQEVWGLCQAFVDRWTVSVLCRD